MATNGNSVVNPWFGLSMGLIGLIIGYGFAVGTFGETQVKGDSQPPVAERPTPPSPPPSDAPPSKPSQNPEKVRPVDKKRDHIMGDKNAEISVIEFSDYQCPFCKRHHQTMKDLVEYYEGKVNWVYRHFPLGSHSEAQISAEGSECAWELGGDDAFWEFTDLIFEKGTDRESLISHAKELGLNESKFTVCLDSEKYASYIEDVVSAASEVGVRGTPANIVLNNKTKKAEFVSGAQNIKKFGEVVDSLLK